MVAGDFFTHDRELLTMKKFMLIIALVSALVSVSFAASRDYSLPTQEGVKTLDELYTKCAEVQDEFSALMESLSQELGTKLVMRPGLKSRERTIAKAAEIFDGRLQQNF